MALSNALEKLGRAMFEAPFRSGGATEDVPAPEEIRLAVIDAVKSKSHRVGSSRVFNHDLIRIHLRGIPASQSEAFQSTFVAEYLEQDVRQALLRSSFRFPSNFSVEIETSPQLPASGEEWVWIETGTKPPVPPEQEIDRPKRTAKLIVVQGSANEAELSLRKSRINIGRAIKVYRADGPSRQNDLAFIEDTAINRTVSREHAHIVVHKKSGEYRLFNDRWYRAGEKSQANCGLWITRDGLSQPVHRSDRGVVLKSGDEILLGDAVVRFVIR
jgi:pSer/pThr/pTyr-binding forkhead associated (FHA) protein